MSQMMELTPAAVATSTPDQRPRMLRQAVQELVGTMFYAPMLQMARENPFRTRLGHGGRGEDIFGAQLDMELARRAARATSSSLAEGITRRLEKGR